MVKEIKITEGSTMVEVDGIIYDVNTLPMNHERMGEGMMYAYTDGNCYIYQGELTDDSQDDGIYYDPSSDSLTIIGQGIDLEETKTYSIDDVIEQLSQHRETEDVDIMTISDKSKPVIRDDDSGFDKVIKQAIIEKGVNPKSYSSHFEKEHTIGNMLSALSSTKDMSTKYFKDWVDIMGLDYELTLRDNGKDQYPMNKKIKYDSSTGKINIEE